MSAISDSIVRVRERVSGAIERSGRSPDDVTLVAVTKTFGPDVVEEIIAAGIEDIGENRVQELVAKADVVGARCRWHLIGPLQRNKVSKVVGLVHMMHAIDGVRIAQAVDRVAAQRDCRVAALLEVNTSGEPGKHGVSPAEAAAVAAALVALPNIDLQGLMTIGPLSVDPVETRACFRLLADLAETVRRATGRPLPHLSMGMSDDFEIAIEEGATMIRLGRIIAGARPAPAG